MEERRGKIELAKSVSESEIDLSIDKEEDAFLAEVLTTGFAAIAKASAEAKELDIPIVKAEGSNLVRIYPDGTKEIIKEVKKAVRTYPKQFKLSYASK
jgi:hypothetical protein